MIEPDSEQVLRVAVTVESFWHPVPGGTAGFLAETLREMAQLDTVALQGVAARRSGPAPTRFAVDIETTHARLARPLLYESWQRFGRPSVESITGAVADVIWASAMVVPPRSAPTVVTVHDLDFLHHPERLSRRGRMFFPQCWEATRKRADLVVCDTHLVADDCVEYGISRDRLRVVPGGVANEPAPDNEVRRVRSEYSLPDEFVLWVGTIEPRKNLPGLVQAMQSVPDVPLVVVGPDGWNIQGAELLAQLGPRALPVGEVPQADLGPLYAAATAFAFPSLAEGFGMPVLEAMVQGTPVITSKGTATEETAAGAAELVDPTDPESIAAGILNVIQTPSRAQELSALGRKRAAEATWRKTALEYVAVFREAACLE